MKRYIVGSENPDRRSLLLNPGVLSKNSKHYN